MDADARATPAALSRGDDLDALLSRAGDSAPAADGVPEESLRAQQALLDKLAKAPWEFHFFQAVRRLEAAYADRPGFGRSDRVSEDPVRFGQEPSLAFAPSTLSALVPGGGRDGASPTRLFVNFLGLLGPNGPLPLHLTEYARERERQHRDPTFARFLDLFNHRMVGLFYRAWAAAQMPASYDRRRPVTRGAKGEPPMGVERDLLLAADRDRFACYIGSLFGLGVDSLRHRDLVPDNAKLHYSGHLSSATRPAEAVQSIIGAYFGVPCRVEEFSGRWVDVPPDYHCRLGVANASLASNGAGAIVGGRIFDRAGSFRLRLGPMTFAQYQRLLPGSSGQGRLSDWVRNILGDELWWDATVCLRAAEVPRAVLGKTARLGWTTWVSSKASGVDREDLVLRAPA